MNRLTVRARTPRAPAAALAAAASLLGCGGHHLADYDFQGASLAMASDLPAGPSLDTGGWWNVDTENPILAAIQVGGRVIREAEARGARERLDSAAVLVDMDRVLLQRTHERSARYLGARLVEEEAGADYVLELFVRDYGLSATEWDAAARLFVDAEAVLLHAPSGAEIWKRHVDESDELTPVVIGGSGTLRDVVTAGYLSTLSVEELAAILERTAQYASDAITERLREDLRDVR